MAMKSSLSLQNLVGVILLPALFSCSKQAQTVSGAGEHYNADTYYVAGGFDAEVDRQGGEASTNGSGDVSTNRNRDNRVENDRRSGSAPESVIADHFATTDRVGGAGQRISAINNA